MHEDRLLEVDQVVGGYGMARVLNGMSISARDREVTVLLGANGAGKTTLMKTLAGLLPSSAGRLRFLGEDITALPSHKRVEAGMVLVPEGRMVFPTLSVGENLRLGAINQRARATWRQELDRVYHLFPKLQERHSQQAVTLSGGEQQMLAIGRGLMARPRLMLLDEPTLGLSPAMSQLVFQLIGKLADEGLTLLLAEQDARRSLACSSYGFVIENGRIALEGAASHLAQDEGVQKAYLGL